MKKVKKIFNYYNTPVIIFIHGVGWVQGSKNDFNNYRNVNSAGPVNYLNLKNIPILVFHGSNGSLIYPGHAENFHAELVRNNIIHEFFLLNTGHGIFMAIQLLVIE